MILIVTPPIVRGPDAPGRPRMRGQGVVQEPASLHARLPARDIGTIVVYISEVLD